MSDLLPEDIMQRPAEVREALMIQAMRALGTRMDNVTKALWGAAASLLIAAFTFAMGIISGAIG